MNKDRSITKDDAPKSIEIGTRLVPIAGSIASQALSLPALGPVAAIAGLMLFLGWRAPRWISQARARRLLERLASDTELTVEDYRAVYVQPPDRAKVQRELRSMLEEIERTIDDEVADALISALRFRTRHPDEEIFVRRAIELLRELRATELRALRTLLTAATKFHDQPTITMWNNRFYSDEDRTPAVLIGKDDGGYPLTPCDPAVVRRLFRLLRETDLGRSTTTVSGAFVYGPGERAAEGPEDSLVIERTNIEKLLGVLVF